MAISHDKENIEATLDALHGQLVAGRKDLCGLVEHRASFGDWSIVLKGADNDTVSQAAMTRCGQETYGFVRDENGVFEPDEPTAAKTRFADIHFSNLGNIAAREDLDWITDYPIN